MSQVLLIMIGATIVPTEIENPTVTFPITYAGINVFTIHEKRIN